MAVKLLKGPFTVDDYHRLAECGVLAEDDRVELVNGQVVEMTPIGPHHAACVNRLTQLFAPVAGRRVTVSVQNPVILDQHQEPQPDFALLQHRADGYAAKHPNPRDILLLIEVADTSLDYDRDVKVPQYARAGLPECWLVNLPADRIEVHREPAGEIYATVRLAARGETLTPLLLPDVTLRVDDVLG